MNPIAQRFYDEAESHSQKPVLADESISFRGIHLTVLPDIYSEKPNYFELQFDLLSNMSTYAKLIFENLPGLNLNYRSFAKEAASHLGGNEYSVVLTDWTVHLKREFDVNYLTLQRTAR